VLVTGGSQTVVTGTLTFDGPTPTAGTVVKLFSTNTAAIKVPASVNVKLTGSQTTSNFTITTLPVKTAQTVMVEAEYPNATFYTVTLGVIPFFLESVSTNPTAVPGGTTAVGTVQINNPSASATGPIVVKLSSTSRDIGLPASVSIPVGKTSATFNITTKVVVSSTQAVIVATLNGGTQQSTLTIQTPGVSSVAVSPATVKGSSTQTVTGTVKLNGLAPAGGIVVSLSSSATAAATVPATVTVPAGATSVTFKIAHKKVENVDYKAVITASVGSSSASATLTVTP